jgi:3-oxoacyl-[acyl-carrier-protein] synthase-1/3-oxoacyl-[acyl-carrier-protein] synthase II
MSAGSEVPVAGLGCICGAGPNLAASMETLFKGIGRPRLPTAFAVQPPAPPVFEVDPHFFDPGAFEKAVTARVPQLALTAATEALNDAGLGGEELQGARVGVCLGTNVACSFNDVSDDPPCDDDAELVFSGAGRFLRNNPSVALVKALRLTGPTQTVVNACSAGTDAIGIGAGWIAAGRCDVVICGGVDALYLVSYLGFKSLMISDNRPCRPFDRHRAGLNLGEGAAVMVLEKAEHLRARRRLARASILGYGASADAHHLTMPDPSGRGLTMAVQQALSAGGLSADDIAFINAHGTGTLDNDVIECRVIERLFPQTPFYSTKAYTGHTLGAAGAIEAVFTAASLMRGQIPRSGGFEIPDPELRLSPVSTITTVKGAAALSQTLAFGGNNAVLAIGRGES